MTNKIIPKDFIFFCKVLSPWTREQETDRMRESVRRGEVSWEAVAKYANESNLAPAFRCALLSRSLLAYAPAELRDYLEELYRFNAGRNEALRQQLLEVTGVLNGIGISPLLLKGSAALVTELFPDPAARFMWDLDLLIPDGKLELCVAALKDAGYAVPIEYQNQWLGVWVQHKHDIPLIRPNAVACVELHRRVSDELGAFLEAGTVWRESVPINCSGLPGATLAVMSPTHQIIHCFAHSELTHDNHALWRLDLRQMHHFAHLCLRYRHEVEWERLAALRKNGDIGRVLGAYMYLAEQLFGVETPVSSPSDAYARRHMFTILLSIDKLWKKRLLMFRAIIITQAAKFSETHLKCRYPEKKNYSVTRLRLHRLSTLTIKYLRVEPWKIFKDTWKRKYDTLG